MLPRGLVIVSQYVQDAVNEQMSHLGLDGDARLPSLPDRLVIRDHHLSEGRRLPSRQDKLRITCGVRSASHPLMIFSWTIKSKGEDVGGLVYAPVLAVQLSNGLIVRHHHSQRAAVAAALTPNSDSQRPRGYDPEPTGGDGPLELLEYVDVDPGGAYRAKVGQRADNRATASR